MMKYDKYNMNKENRKTYENNQGFQRAVVWRFLGLPKAFLWNPWNRLAPLLFSLVFVDALCGSTDRSVFFSGSRKALALAVWELSEWCSSFHAPCFPLDTKACFLGVPGITTVFFGGLGLPPVFWFHKSLYT